MTITSTTVAEDHAVATAPAADHGRRRSAGAFHEGRHPSTRSILGNAALLAVAAVVLAFVTYRTRLEVTNIDGISYMSIAQQYATGHWGDAVNGYWSPLVSWLMAPLIAVGLGQTTAFGVVNLVASIAILGIGAWLLLRTTGNGWTAAWSILAVSPLLIANVSLQTPDVLVLLWSLVFVWALLAADRAWHGSVRRIVLTGVLLGAVCALGYCTKAFLVPVFLVVVPLWALIRWCQDRRDHRERRSLLLPAVALVAVVAFSAPWVIALSAKFGGFEVGSSLTVNVSGKFSDTDSTDAGEYRIPSPPNPLAVSPNEDRTPSLYDAGVRTAERAEPLAPAANTPAAPTTSHTTTLVGKVRYYVHERIEAIPFYFARIGSFAPFALAIGAAYVAALAIGAAHYRRFVFAGIVALSSGVYLLGYAGIATVDTLGGNSRYYLPLFTGSVLIAGALLPTIWRAARRGTWVRRGLAIVACATVVVAAYSQNVNGVRAPFSTMDTSPAGIERGQVLGGVIVPDEPLVQLLDANHTIPAGSTVLGTNARDTVRVAFRLGLHAYGEAGQRYDYQDPAFVDLMQRSGVEYFLQYRGPTDARERDYSAIGELVGSFPVEQTCQDIKSAPVQPCLVDVVKVARS